MNVNEKRIDRLQKKLDKLRGAALTVMRYAIEDAANAPEKVKRDAEQTKMGAPMYLHMAAAIATETMRAEAQKTALPAGGSTMNIMVIGQAESPGAWMEQVRQFQQQPGQPKTVIEATVTEKP